MWARVITLLVTLSEIARQIIRLVERRRVEKEAVSNEEELRKIEQDPAEWFADHFGGHATVIVRTCDHDDGDDAGELLSCAVSDPDPSAEAKPDGQVDG